MEILVYNDKYSHLQLYIGDLHKTYVPEHSWKRVAFPPRWVISQNLCNRNIRNSIIMMLDSQVLTTMVTLHFKFVLIAFLRFTYSHDMSRLYSHKMFRQTKFTKETAQCRNYHLSKQRTHSYKSSTIYNALLGMVELHFKSLRSHLTKPVCFHIITSNNSYISMTFKVKFNHTQ